MDDPAVDNLGVTLFGPERPAVVGHRGSPRVERENTPASFAAAAAAGATWVELDVRITAEGDLAVHHDPHLPDGRPVVSLGLPALRQAGVCSLVDVLADLPAGLGVDIEVKNLPGEPDHDEGMAVVAALVDVLPTLGCRPHVVSSFNPMVLLDLVARRPEVPRGLLTIGVGMTAGAEAAVELGCHGLFCHVTTDGLGPAGVEAAHDAGLSVMVWTVDDGPTVQRLAAAGVDALCTNDPAGVSDVLQRRT